MITVAVGSFLVTLALTPVMRWWGRRHGRMDVPSGRSSHVHPTPRTGGYAIWAGLACAFALSAGVRIAALVTIVGGATILVALAAVDEVRELPRVLRLWVQVTVAAICALVTSGTAFATLSLPFTGTFSLGLLAVPVTALWIVGLTNAYNFMDGLNGMAAAEAVVSAAFLAILFMARRDVPDALVAVAVAAAAIAFLFYNLRGSIFMGDSGSTTLGFVLALLVVRASNAGVPVLAAALPLAPFVLDAGVTLLRRALRGEPFFSTPHRVHAYQRLQQSGWSHVRVTALWSLLAVVSGAAGLLVMRTGDGTAVLAILFVAALHAAVFLWVEARQPMPA